jgi:pantothenate kinase
LIVRVYVDDLIITDTDEETITVFKTEMKYRFQMSDLGLLSYYLGIEVKQSKAWMAYFFVNLRTPASFSRAAG